MSPRRLGGWEPRTVTEFIYEGGHIVGAVTTREPEFSAHDVALFLAESEYDATVNRFGTPVSEATNPANQFRYRTDEAPTVDWQELALEKAQRAYYASDDPKNPMPRQAHRWSPPRLTGTS